MADATETLRAVRAQFDEFLSDLLGEELMSEWSEAANALYKEQFAKKQNPYGEPWAPRPGDDKRKSSPYFGKVKNIDRDSFELRVAAPNANRSCVPFEPRGLGAWRPKFEEILGDRARMKFRAVRP